MVFTCCLPEDIYSNRDKPRCASIFINKPQVTTIRVWWSTVSGNWVTVALLRVSYEWDDEMMFDLCVWLTWMSLVYTNVFDLCYITMIPLPCLQVNLKINSQVYNVIDRIDYIEKYSPINCLQFTFSFLFFGVWKAKSYLKIASSTCLGGRTCPGWIKRSLYKMASTCGASAWLAVTVHVSTGHLELTNTSLPGLRFHEPSP